MEYISKWSSQLSMVYDQCPFRGHWYDLQKCIALGDNDDCPCVVYARAHYLQFLLHKITRTVQHI